MQHFYYLCTENSLKRILMDALFRKSDRLLANTRTDIIRDKMDDIHWNAQLISIMGAKGVGKSTLIRQYLKQNFKLGDRRVLYCSADTVDFSMRTLGGRVVYTPLRSTAS